MWRTGCVLIACVLWAAGGGKAQKTLRFDMGSSTSSVEPGFTRITPATAYTKASGHGWTVPPSVSWFRPPPIRNIRHNLPMGLIRDGNGGYRDCTFQVDLASGKYLVIAYLGDPGTLRARTPRDHMDILAGGVPVVKDAFARTASMKARFDYQPFGGFKRARFLASPSGGSLKLTFHCDGRGTSMNAVMGIEIYPYSPPPVYFDHTAKKLAASPAYQALLGPALTAFNQGDYRKSRALLDKVGDPLARAWGYAWWNGWLKGMEEDLDTDLLEKTIKLLEGLNRPDDPSVAVLLQDARDMEKGALYNRIRGYSSKVFPESLDNIVYNLSAAVQLFEQMDGDTLSAPDSARPECPFLPKARFLIARNMYSRYTKVGDPKSPWASTWLGILKNEFGPNLALFPKALNLELFVFFAGRYGVNGGMSLWRGPGYTPSYNPKDAWWAGYTEFPDHPAAPVWANRMRAYYKAARGAGKWWMQKRLFDGELGGGGGDDVEGGALLSLPALEAVEPGGVLEEGGRACLEKVLFGHEVDQDQGYFKGCADVEHAGEYTSNPFFLLLPTNFGSPSHLELALRTLRNMDEKADPNPWTRPFAADRRHFLSYKFGARSVCGPARDIPCNVRAVIPGFFLMDYNGSPRVAELFEELARAWAENAMSTAQGKPKGIPPVAVSSTLPAVFGTGGNWWKNGGYYDLPKGANYFSYLFSLFLSSYERSAAKDRQLYLEPILHSGLLVSDLIAGKLKGSAPGQDKWTAETLKAPIANAVARAYPALAKDPALKISQADLARLRKVIDTYAAPYLQYLRQSSTGTKNKKFLEDTFLWAREWMRYFFPLATTSVSYTDRIYVFSKGSHHLLYSAMLGGPFSVDPAYVVSWVNPVPAAGEQDFAALVHDYGVDSLDILLFNFDNKKRDFAFRIWRNLEFGKYSVKVGDDANHDDKMDGPPRISFEFVFDARGKEVLLKDVPAGVLQKVELRKTAPLPGGGVLLPDLAVGEGDLALRPGGKAAVRVHNLGAAAVKGGTVELLEGGKSLGSWPLPSIQAPNDLTPRSVLLLLPYRPSAPPKPLTVRLKAPAGTREITLYNNHVTRIFTPGNPVLGITNLGRFGKFDVEVESPYDAGSFFWIAVGVTGTSPGLPLGGGLVLPLNWDSITEASLFYGSGIFDYPLGILDSRGKGLMKVRIPPIRALKGLVFHFAAATFTWEGFRAVSKPLSFRL